MGKVIKTPQAEQVDYASENLPQLTTFFGTINGQQVVVEAVAVEEAIKKIESEN